ncbi:viral IAP-associated factor homolog [Culicoides brevitarsis]|uniref:viral IAP-associated factor homolog n=1 Tax=Culicoides brevitarsis TaxID=469753 RepID=UPI00307B3470
MQDPNEDSEWNDVLRAKGIIPQKEKEITEDDIVKMVEETIHQKQKDGKDIDEMNLDELDELEDSEDEFVLQEYRNKRIAEMKALAEKNKFGTLGEISGQDYVQEVNKAGEGIWVVLHLYSRGVPFCQLLNQHLAVLAQKFPATKFLKSIATTCIPNYPEKNLPTVFVYFEGQMKRQFIGEVDLRGPNTSIDELEYLLGREGAVNTEIKDDPRRKVQDKMFMDLNDANDW